MRIVIDLEAAQSPLSRNRGIGRYSISLAKAMLRHRGRHEILVALNGAYAGTIEEVRRDFEGLLPQTSILVWHPSQPPASAASPAQRAAMAAVRSGFFASLNADIVHVASPFDFSEHAYNTIGVHPEPHRTAVTLYDLIPHIYADIYLRPAGAAQAYYERLENFRRADLWLAISESSRQEGIGHAQLPAQRAVNISAAADEHFTAGAVPVEYEVSLRVQYGLWRPFVMYTGGIDHRKNIEGLIEAWAALPPELRSAHQLAIVCSVVPADRARLEALVREVGLATGEVVFTGFVSEEHLLNLYRLCRLFVFPSLHEGFGLPALEAMSCGAPVIGADNSSIPEVIGRADALFDAKSREAITAKLRQCLEDGAFRAELARFGPEQAQRFSWDRSARIALAAMEALPPRANAGVVAPVRPTLAYVSPLPPEHSGVATYGSELIPALAQHYDIDLVVSQDRVDGVPSGAYRKVRSAEWFMQHGHEYDRVLYHFGNSHYHEPMIPLLRRHPGTVVLHDFFLSGMQANREFVTEKRPVWSRALYESHGWRALLRREKAVDMTDLILEFPANFEVLREAQGVIVHSPHSIHLAGEWYGPAAAQGWRVIPHMRVARPLSRDEARRELGYRDDDFVLCAFGLLGPTKMNDRLLRAWRISSLAADPHCRLVFVGENVSGSDYGRELASLMPEGGRVSITGWADEGLFRQYLNAADVAVQLRTLSRGETSGTVLDAMAHAVPVIANANGTMAFLPREAAWVLDEQFSDEQLARALESLRDDPARRLAMSRAARAVIQTRHSPADCAAAYREAIEAFAARALTGRPALTHEVARLLPPDCGEQVAAGIARAIAANQPSRAPAQQLLADVSGWLQAEAESELPQLFHGLVTASLPGWRIEPVYLASDGRWRYARKFMLQRYACNPQLLEDDLVEMRRGDAWASFTASALPAQALEAGITPVELGEHGDPPLAWAWIAASAQPLQGARCFVDISEQVRHDWGSGIQRVVMNYLLALLRRPPAGVRVVPVYAKPGQPGYRFASAFLRKLADLQPLEGDCDTEIDPRAGDTFYAIDLQPHFIPEHAHELREMRTRGVKVVFQVYDLLPITLPDCFVPGAAAHHERWLRVVAESDLAICNSQATADEVRDWFVRQGRGHTPQLVAVHQGADIGTRASRGNVPPDAQPLLARMREHPAFLMVGTIEPRKAHATVLDAFEWLWSQQDDCMLVIVGRPGWLHEGFVERLRSHQELGKRLVWFEDAGDELLEESYRASTALIQASRGEGFGLPLVEAAQRGLPVIARDLPVFREIAGGHAFYFRDDSPEGLGTAIRKWLDLKAQGTHPRAQGMPWCTWDESAARVRRLLETS